MAKAACAEGSAAAACFMSLEVVSMLVPGLTAASQPARSRDLATAPSGGAQAALPALLDVAATSHIVHTCAEAVHDLFTTVNPSCIRAGNSDGGHQLQQQAARDAASGLGLPAGGGKGDIESSTKSHELIKSLQNGHKVQELSQGGRSADVAGCNVLSAGCAGPSEGGDLQVSWLACLHLLAEHHCSTTPEAAKWLAASSPLLRLLHSLVARAVAAEQAVAGQAVAPPVKSSISAKIRRSSSTGAGRLGFGRGSNDDAEAQGEGEQAAGTPLSSAQRDREANACLVAGLLALRMLRHLAYCCLSAQMVPAERQVKQSSVYTSQATHNVS